MKLGLIAIVMAVAAASLASSTADAAIVFNIREVGSDVVVNASGSFNTAGAGSASNLFESRINPSIGRINIGPNAGTALAITGFTGPDSFGPGSSVLATSYSGDYIYFIGGTQSTTLQKILALAPDYISGAALNGNALFANQTFATLGVNPGNYVWSANGDTVTINISAVPEPTTWGMMLLGFGIMGFALRHRNVRTRGRFA